MPNRTVILHCYKEYMENTDLADKDRQMLSYCFYEIVGLCEFDVEGKNIEGRNIFKTCHNIR